MGEYRVLLVDDEEELVATLVERLSYRDFVAEYATNASAALDMLRESSFDVIVVDLKLPGMSGTDLIHVIRKAYPSVPIILVTGHGIDEDDDYSGLDGVSAFLPKPFDVAVLAAKMKEAIEGDEL